MTQKSQSYGLVLALACAMFFMFAMTTDAVGEIIKIAKTEMSIDNTQASAFHWSTMVAIALSGFFLGTLADKFGRKKSIIFGLFLYGIASALFYFANTLNAYVIILFISGLAIGIFKTAALALLGDITSNSREHSQKMNLLEGFFAVGAVIGPMLVIQFNEAGISWKWLYLVAAAMCAAMILATFATRFPDPKIEGENVSMARTFSMVGNKTALYFALAIAMYVACEVAIFVWMPSYAEGFVGSDLAMNFALYGVSIFFALRAIGRFLASWALGKFDWKVFLLIFAALIFLCFLLTVIVGKKAGVFLLPISGLFMSMIYPTVNSKGISAFPSDQHGSVAGLLLFFTAAGAALGPVLMAFVSDKFADGNLTAGFVLATVFAGILLVWAFINWKNDPMGHLLNEGE